MIELATVLDEERPGQRRAAGRMIRRKIIVAVDRFNIVLAESTDTGNPIGRKFVARLSQLISLFPEFDVDVAQATKAIAEGFARIFGQPIKVMKLAAIDAQFFVAKRTPDSSGELMLYRELRSKGYGSSEEDDESE